MATLQGTQTQTNTLTAFAGESQARNRSGIAVNAVMSMKAVSPLKNVRPVPIPGAILNCSVKTGNEHSLNIPLPTTAGLKHQSVN